MATLMGALGWLAERDMLPALPKPQTQKPITRQQPQPKPAKPVPSKLLGALEWLRQHDKLPELPCSQERSGCPSTSYEGSVSDCLPSEFDGVVVEDVADAKSGPLLERTFGSDSDELASDSEDEKRTLSDDEAGLMSHPPTAVEEPEHPVDHDQSDGINEDEMAFMVYQTEDGGVSGRSDSPVPTAPSHHAPVKTPVPDGSPQRYEDALGPPPMYESPAPNSGVRGSTEMKAPASDDEWVFT